MTTEATKWTADAATNKAATHAAWIVASRCGDAEQEAMTYKEACAAAAAYQAMSEAHASDIEVIVKAAEAEYNTAWDLAVMGAGSAFDAEAVEDAAWYLAVSGEGSTLFAAWDAVESAREARDAHYAAYASYADAELGIAQAAADAILAAAAAPQKRAPQQRDFTVYIWKPARVGDADWSERVHALTPSAAIALVADAAGVRGTIRVFDGHTQGDVYRWPATVGDHRAAVEEVW